jgi:mannan endo-1,4-beta-mannosidase
VVVLALAAQSAPPAQRAGLPTTPGSYLGLYTAGVPGSYAPLAAFTVATGVRPNIALYYSGWGEPFQAAFASQAAAHDAIPLVQINPVRTSIAAIAAGKYDSYLDAYAAAVRAYRRPVMLSFGHEMNGWWSSWGYRHTPPTVFVAAWQHIVTLFRRRGATNVTWMWTINIIDAHGGIRAPAAWWPGRSYVTWVGIDGYYHKSSWTFASLFGPTIKAVRALTRYPIPILISETGATPDIGQPAKIANLFAGVRSYGLLGFVWFDARNWRLASRGALAAFGRGAKADKILKAP